MLFPECVRYINLGACDFFFSGVLRLSGLFNPIRGSHTPFSQSLFSPVPHPAVLGRGGSIRLETTSDPAFPRLSRQRFTSHVTSSVEGGGFTIQSYEIILQKNGRFILTTTMWRSQDHFGKATFMLSFSPSLPCSEFLLFMVYFTLFLGESRSAAALTVHRFPALKC